MADIARIAEQAAVNTAGVVSAAVAMDIGDLNWWSIGIASAIAGGVALVASISRGVRRESDYGWQQAVSDFFVGVVAGVLVFALANHRQWDANTQLALMVAAGWTGQFALDRGKGLIDRVFPK